MRGATHLRDGEHAPDVDEKTTVETETGEDLWVGQVGADAGPSPAAPIFGEPPDPRKAIAIPGTYFGLSPPHPGRDVRLPARVPRAAAAHRRWRRVVTLAVTGILMILAVGLIAWLSMRYNGVGLHG